MKTIFNILLVFTLCLAISIPAIAGDSYYVIHVKGSVTNKTSGKVLKVGDQVNSTDQLKFATADAGIIIMGSKGKFTITPSANPNNKSELVAYVQNALLPMKSSGHLSTRGGEADGVIDLKTYFGVSKFAIIGDKLAIKLNTTRYPVNDNQVFIYRYVYNDTVVSKKMDFKDNHLILDKTALYTFNGKFIDPSKINNVEVYYTNLQTKHSTKIVNFMPQFVKEDDLKAQLKLQRKLLKEQKVTDEQINKDLLQFTTDVYGRTDEEIFNEWLKTSVNAE
ncbi:MAG: hypothetical protein K2X86_00660 [Cytophagaceae bacterium]|nr:hypothetical protein [Cytophagaceae bacterium]